MECEVFLLRLINDMGIIYIMNLDLKPLFFSIFFFSRQIILALVSFSLIKCQTVYEGSLVRCERLGAMKVKVHCSGRR